MPTRRSIIETLAGLGAVVALGCGPRVLALGPDPAPEEVLPVPVYEVVALADGKWAAIVSVEGTELEQMHGELRIFDPARGASERIAGDVMLVMSALNQRPGTEGCCGFPLTLGPPRDELLYIRHGGGDEPRALWRVAP